jgi:hypothetical protein
MSARVSSSCSGLAVRPSTALAASPGKSSVPAKTRTDTTSSVASAAASRRARNAAIGWRPRTVAGTAGGPSAGGAAISLIAAL